MKKIRSYVTSNSLNFNRLPKWVASAKVKMAKINNSNIFLFEESPYTKDIIEYKGDVKSDLQFFLELPEFIPKASSFKAPSNQGLVIFQGEHDEKGSVIFDQKTPYSALFNVGYTRYHSPIALVNIFLKLNWSNNLLVICFVPFALYVHDQDLVDFEIFWNKCTPNIENTLFEIHNSKTGDFYQLQAEYNRYFLMGKYRSVIVFGKDSEPSTLTELLRVRDYLRSKQYEAVLLRDLSEHSSMSLEQKVRTWIGGSRFCIMIDQKPSGHLTEYPIIKSTLEIMAILRPEGEGSTYMIGDESILGLNYIKIFDFRNSPLEVIDDAIIWAEELVTKRSIELDKIYPWRKKRVI
jgi:hypothetical protein